METSASSGEDRWVVGSLVAGSNWEDREGQPWAHMAGIVGEEALRPDNMFEGDEEIIPHFRNMKQSHIFEMSNNPTF